MPLSIDDFRNHFNNHNEVSKADKFDVFIQVPDQVSSGTGYTGRELAIQCEISELPGKDITMIEYRHYGFTKRIPHMNQYGHINFTFYCTGDLVEKKIFDRWMDLMIPADTGLVNYPVDEQGLSTYESQILVNQYDSAGRLVYQVTLIDAIPTSMSPMQQNWSDDSVHRLSVSFAFFKWTSDQTAYGAAQQPVNHNLTSNYTNNSQQISNIIPAIERAVGLPAAVAPYTNNLNKLFNF